MANHKRRKPKSARSGCLLCKPHKANGVKKRRTGWNKGNLMDHAAYQKQCKEETTGGQ